MVAQTAGEESVSTGQTPDEDTRKALINEALEKISVDDEDVFKLPKECISCDGTVSCRLSLRLFLFCNNLFSPPTLCLFTGGLR